MVYRITTVPWLLFLVVNISLTLQWRCAQSSTLLSVVCLVPRWLLASVESRLTLNLAYMSPQLLIARNTWSSAHRPWYRDAHR